MSRRGGDYSVVLPTPLPVLIAQYDTVADAGVERR